MAQRSKDKSASWLGLEETTSVGGGAGRGLPSASTSFEEKEGIVSYPACDAAPALQTSALVFRGEEEE